MEEYATIIGVIRLHVSKAEQPTWQPCKTSSGDVWESEKWFDMATNLWQRISVK